MKGVGTTFQTQHLNTAKNVGGQTLTDVHTFIKCIYGCCVKKILYCILQYTNIYRHVNEQ